jgi:hypothetical protein
MVVLETDAEGNPTIWCDPEISDLVRALNVGGVRTKASCSGHGEKPFGIVTLKDGRELLVMPDWETTRRAERLLDAGLSAKQQGHYCKNCLGIQPETCLFNPQRQQQGQAVALDRMAIRLLVEAGFVTEDKANEALRIAHGFDKGPLAPQPMQQGGREVYWANGAQWPNVAPPSAPVGVEAISREAFEAYIAKDSGDLSTFGFGRDIHYSNSAVNNAWDGWRAGAKWCLAQQPAAVDEVVRAAVLAEREACAKACDDRAAYYHAGDDDGPVTRRGIACEACASVIRWRSTVSPKFLAKHEADIEERLATQHQEPTT